ncbi:MAG: ABC transporter ATP-binding protein [Bacilli bacterium]|nr:ABC transporter ATP-binding protein [Bacilli bacterium]
MEILRVNNLSKKYTNGENIFYALKNINFSVKKGEFVAITGKSGSGKSTLLHILSGLDSKDEGEVIIDNQNIFELNDNDLTIFRRKNIGIIYQFYNLLPMLDVKENILMPTLLDKRKVNKKRFNELIKTLDLDNKLDSMPNDLSGGQQQRTAIGRALINRPKILFADEPTGNLDSKNTKKIMKLLEYYNKKFKQTIIMVTHDNALARRCDRNIVIKDGKIIKDEYKKTNKKK